MSDRTLIMAACLPMLCGITLLVLLSRVPARALPSGVPNASLNVTPRQEVARQPGWTGVVVAASTAELAAPASGRVDAVYVRTGDTVAAGDRLLQLDLSDVASSVKMAGAQVKERASDIARFRARARAASQRLERLRAGEAWLSKQELERAVEDARVAEAELQAAYANMGVSRIALKQQRLRATRQTLEAPFSGTVIALGVDEGDSVGEGQVVMRIVGRGRQVRFAFPPGAMPASGGRSVMLRLEGHQEGVMAEVDTVRPEVDPSSQLVFATAPLPPLLAAQEAWIPGASVTVTPVGQPRETR